MDRELLQLRGNVYDSLSAYNMAQGRYLEAVAAKASIRIKCTEADASLTAAREYELTLNSFLTHLISLPPSARTERAVGRVRTLLDAARKHIRVFSDLKEFFDR